MSGESSPSKSYQENLGWFFGQGIPFLDPSRVPVESDIVKLCIHTYDSLNDSSEKTPDKNDIIKEVMDMLIDYFKTNDPNAVLKTEKVIKEWLERLLARAKKYEFRLHKSKKHVNDEDWITREKSSNGFNKIVNITKGSGYTPSSTPLSPKRGFFDEDTIQDQVNTKKIFMLRNTHFKIGVFLICIKSTTI